MTHTDGLKNVETLINRFGGMRPMSRKVEVPLSTIQGWKKRDHIPSERVDEVVSAAKKHQISLDGFDLQSATANENTKSDETDAKEASSTSSFAAPPSAPQTQRTASQPNINYQLDANAIKRSAVKRSIFTTVSIMAIVGGVGYFLFGTEAKEIANVASNQTQIENRINMVESTVRNSFDSINQKVTELANVVGAQQNDMGAYVSPNDIPVTEMIGSLANRFENFTKVMEGQGDTEKAFADLQGIVNTIQGRIDGLDASLEKAKTENAEMAKSMENVNGRDISAAAMLLAMTHMRDNLNRSEPFQDDLTVLQELVGNDDPELSAAINRLAPYAENGILTPAGISDELRGVTGEIVSSALRGENVSVQDKVMARIGKILSVEKNGEPVLGIKEQAIIARAQKALEKGDTKTALMELQKLEGDAASAANPITNQLQGAIQADETFTKIMDGLVRKLSGQTNAPIFMEQ